MSKTWIEEQYEKDDKFKDKVDYELFVLGFTEAVAGQMRKTGMTPEEIAAGNGMPIKMVKKILCGEKEVTLKVLFKIARYVGLYPKLVFSQEGFK